MTNEETARERVDLINLAQVTARQPAVVKTVMFPKVLGIISLASQVGLCSKEAVTVSHVQ